jgi:hypothetical protein
MLRHILADGFWNVSHYDSRETLQLTPTAVNIMSSVVKHVVGMHVKLCPEAEEFIDSYDTLCVLFVYECVSE